VPSLRDEVTYWQNQAVDAHHNLLATIQSAAGKWQAAIAAFLGLYATTGFVLGPDKLATLPVHGNVEIGIVVAFFIAGIVGIIAVIMANLAAQGIPEIFTGTPVTGPLMYQLVSSRARSARCQLHWAMGLAGAAGVLILVISGFLLGAGIRAQAHPSDILINTGHAYCGLLIHHAGQVGVKPPGGAFVSAAGGSLTPVNACPVAG
jgi:hypothetical protein